MRVDGNGIVSKYENVAPNVKCVRKGGREWIGTQTNILTWDKWEREEDDQWADWSNC